MEAEGAYSLSLVRHGRIRSEEVWDSKAQALRKSGLMIASPRRRTLCRPWRPRRPEVVLPASPPPKRQPHRPAPRHTAPWRSRHRQESALAKALGNETGRPTLTLDIGALMGSLVGQTERNVREALRIVDAMAPAVLFIDEIEKGTLRRRRLRPHRQRRFRPTVRHASHMDERP